MGTVTGTVERVVGKHDGLFSPTLWNPI